MARLGSSRNYLLETSYWVQMRKICAIRSLVSTRCTVSKICGTAHHEAEAPDDQRRGLPGHFVNRSSIEVTQLT